MQNKEISTTIEGKQGNYTGLRLLERELEVLRLHINQQCLTQIEQILPSQSLKFAEYGIERYHEFAHLLDHKSAWPKKNRILPENAVADVRQFQFFRQLESDWGEFGISDEEELGREEIYWRLVRPEAPSDVGPLHADKWFWDLGHGIMPKGMQRIKVWIAVCCEPSLNGLRYVPGSHLQDWKYFGKCRDGFLKPCFDESQVKQPIELFHTAPGDIVVFHDGLLHGGAINKGKQTRVSVEFTMLVKEQI